jgi:two-component system, NarL family, nitrate/nitrite response regulator NarL
VVFSRLYDVGGIKCVLSGAAAAIANSERLPTRLVFFTGFAEDRELVELSAAGAYGVILKDVALEKILQALRQVADGRRLSPLPLLKQAGPSRQGANVEDVLMVLTDRERQIMRLVSEGLSNKEIGRRLNIVDGTIKVHLHNIFQKLEITNRTVLAALAISKIDSAGLPTGNQVRRIRKVEQNNRLLLPGCTLRLDT